VYSTPEWIKLALFFFLGGLTWTHFYNTNKTPGSESQSKLHCLANNKPISRPLHSTHKKWEYDLADISHYMTQTSTNCIQTPTFHSSFPLLLTVNITRNSHCANKTNKKMRKYDPWRYKISHDMNATSANYGCKPFTLQLYPVANHNRHWFVDTTTVQ
jgi:hypothetical protein